MTLICGRKMLKNPYIKLSVIIVALFVAIGVTYERLDMFKLIGYQPSEINILNSDKIKSQADQEGVNEPESPAYFSIFRFINNFAPGKK